MNNFINAEDSFFIIFYPKSLLQNYLSSAENNFTVSPWRLIF